MFFFGWRGDGDMLTHTIEGTDGNTRRVVHW